MKINNEEKKYITTALESWRDYIYNDGNELHRIITDMIGRLGDYHEIDHLYEWVLGKDDVHPEELLDIFKNIREYLGQLDLHE